MADTQIQNTPDIHQVTVDELSNKIQETTNELNQLKNGLSNLSLEQQNDKLSDIENAIMDCSEDLANLEKDGTVSIDKEKLNTLKLQINTLRTSKDVVQKQIEQQTIEALNKLDQSVAQNEGTEQEQEKGDKQEGNDQKKSRKWLRIGGGVLAGRGIFRLGKRIFGKKDKKETATSTSTPETKKSRRQLRKEKREQRRRERAERRANRPWRKRFLIGSAVAGGTVIGGVQVYKHRNQIKSWVKERLGLALSFDEAKQKVEDEVRNGKNDADHFGAFNSNFEDGITFDEQTQEICSYDQKTKIDKKNKKLEGLDVGFSSYEELIHAANIVNFAKRKLRGRGSTARPFGQTERGGDISFNCSASGKQEFLSANNSNEWSWILGTIGVAGGGILGGYCAGVKGAAIGGLSGGLGGYALGSYVDNTSAAGRCCSTISRGKNFDLFILYLNDQKDENGKSLWESAGEQHIDPDGSPINGLVDNGEKEDITKREGVLAEIEKEYGEDQSGRRNFNILRNKNNPNEYTIQSYGQKARLTIEGGPTDKQQQIDYSKITKIHIEKYQDTDWGKGGLNIDFPKTEEGLKEAIRVCNLTNMIREDRGLRGGDSYPFYWGRYSTPPCLDMDTSGFRGKTILSRDGAKKTPTLFKDLQKGSTGGLSAAVGYTKDYQTKMQNNAINDTTEGSQYIKFLHQMGQGKYWKDPRARY